MTTQAEIGERWSVFTDYVRHSQRPQHNGGAFDGYLRPTELPRPAVRPQHFGAYIESNRQHIIIGAPRRVPGDTPVTPAEPTEYPHVEKRSRAFRSLIALGRRAVVKVRERGDDV